MKLTSHFSDSPIYWRAFNSNDHLYWVGLPGQEGTLSNNGSTNLINLPDHFKIEIRRNGLWGPVLTPAGKIYSSTDQLIVNSSGQLEMVAQENIPATGIIKLSYSGPLVGEKNETEQFNNNFKFTNDSVAMDSFTIKRDAITTVSSIGGVYHRENGEFQISGNINVSYLMFSGNSQIAFSTGPVVSPTKKYSGTGSPLNSSTCQLTLVGAGSVSVLGLGMTFEYYVNAAIVLDHMPK